MPNLILRTLLLRTHWGRCRFRGAGWLLLFSLLAPVRTVQAQSNVTATPPSRLEMTEPYLSATNGLGSWIWEEKTLDNQTCHFWKSFEIPSSATVARARLVMTTDNEFTLYLDGRSLGRGAEWRELFVFDVTQLLSPGRHVLAVDGYNGSFFAGMLLGLRVELADGRNLEVKSDENWRIVPDGVNRWETRTEPQPDWPAASIIAPLGGSPWWTAPAAVIMMPPLLPTKVLFWQTGWFQVSLGAICLFVILISSWLMMELAIHRRERYLLQGERARIARDIHDDMGARLTQLVVHGEVTQNELPSDSDLRPQLTWMCEEVRGLLSTMDEILWAVNPQRDTLSDFADYVCNYAQEFLKPTRIQCFFAVDLEMPAAVLNLPLRRSLLLAIKETLNNACKHSEATELHLQIQWQGPRLVVVVQDNGKGFDTKNVKPGRNGLSNMTSRLSELGGSCAIISQPGNGCRVEFTVPLKRPLRSRIWKAGPLSGLSREINRAPN